MLSKEDVKAIVHDAVENVTGIKDISDDTCLLDRELNIFPADFLYVFECIEKKLGKAIYKILEEYAYDVFIMKRLVDAIYSIYSCTYKDEGSIGS